MPRSPFAARLAEIHSPRGRPREKVDSISRQRAAGKEVAPVFRHD
jgi:hypothetical protein